jgi:ubiquinone/menaquinone biosynthesis C-methylase UbiE
MGAYRRYLLPRLINLVMQDKATAAERARYVPLATGAVLEVGAGSALNLPFYGRAVERLVAVDPSRELWGLGHRRLAAARVRVDFVQGSAESIPVPNGVFDTIVLTWTLCSIDEPARAVGEMLRVLKSTGRLIFVEHGRAPDHRVAAWQDRLNPWWRRVAGGCNMNRTIDTLIATGGKFVSAFIRARKPLAA